MQSAKRTPGAPRAPPVLAAREALRVMQLPAAAASGAWLASLLFNWTFRKMKLQRPTIHFDDQASSNLGCHPRGCLAGVRHRQSDAILYEAVSDNLSSSHHREY